MGSLCATVVLTLLPPATARRFGGVSPGGGGSGIGSSSVGNSGGPSIESGGTDDFVLDPLDLQTANVVSCGFLLLATIVLFGFSLRALFYKSSRLPGAGVVLTLIVGGITYALNVALIIESYTVDDPTLLTGGFEIVPLDLQTASDAFDYLRDVAIFVAIALVLRNRYLSTNISSPGLIRFTRMACFFPTMMVVFFAANLGLSEAVVIGGFDPTIASSEAESGLTTANNLFFVFVAFQILGTIFLTISTFLVKARTKDDRIMKLTIFAVIPLLSLYSLARLIFVILEAVLPFSAPFTLEVAFALELSMTIVYGVLFIAILSVLVYLTSRPHLWGAQPPSIQSAPFVQVTPLTQGAPIFQGTPIHDGSTSQFFVMGAPPGQGTPTTEGTTSPQIIVHSAPPGTQFPGQWGYLQQPQVQQTSSSQPQQYAYVPVYPVQTSGASVPATNMTPASHPPPA